MKFCLNCARLVSRTQLYSIKYTHCISRASEFIPYVSWQEFNEEHWDAFIVCERYRDKRPATLDGPVWEFLHCITLLYDLNEFSISGYLHTLTTCSLAWCVMPEAYWAHYVPGIYHYCPLSQFDADRNGHITASEIGALMKALGEDVPGYKIRDMIREVDLDENGTVEFNEFVEVRGNT